MVVRDRGRLGRPEGLTPAPARPWADRAFLRSQYRTDANLNARQSVCAFQYPRIDLAARVLDLAGVSSAGVVADVGCGNGFYLAELIRRGLGGRVVGFDLSPGMLAAARQRLTGAALVPGAAVPGLAVADATALPLADASAALVVSAHMLYHVPEPADAVRELRRVVRPGGRVVIALNGPGRMRQFRAAVAAATGSDPPGERVTLDSSAALARPLFRLVTGHDLVSELRVPSLDMLADYARSSATAWGAEDIERFLRAAAATIPRTPEGNYRISTHSGCLICEPG